MKPKNTKLSTSDIGYNGKSIDRLNREELIELVLHLAQKVYSNSSVDKGTNDIV